MNTMKRDRNANGIAWPIIDDGESHFTPCVVPKIIHVLSNEYAGCDDWARRLPSHIDREDTPDEEIARGRLESFGSIRELLGSLKK